MITQSVGSGFVGGLVVGSEVGGAFVGPSVVGAFDVGAPEGFLVGIVVGFEEVGLEDVGLGVGPRVGSGPAVGLAVGHPVIFL